jgi:hypothetical protein
MLLQFKSQPRQKLTRFIRKLIGPRSNWRTEDVKEAMDTIERGFMLLKKASQYWNILLTSLSNHLTNKTMPTKCGPLGILSIDEEATIVRWVFGM